jgi:hypothetical protein
MSVFDPLAFADPPNRFRPLRIVHGLDQFLAEAGTLAVREEADPAGQWAERLTGSATDSPALDDLVLIGTEGIDAQLARMVRLGLGGIVTNVSFQDYLVSPRQWELLRYGQRRAMELGLRVWLYDEKGYPSGTAGGIVTRANPDYTALGLACYLHEVPGGQGLVLPLPASCRAFVSACVLRDLEHATSADVVDLSAYVDAWGVLRWQAPAEAESYQVLYFAERVMYEGTHSQGNVSEFKHYVNLLEPAAVRAFLRVTHEAYHRELSGELWQGIEAIFTDEPSFMTFYTPALPERYWGKVPVGDSALFQDRPPAVPWTRDYSAYFEAEKGYRLEPHLYALFFSQSEEACYIRQDYYETLTRRYAGAFYGQVQDWCREHGIASSGHLLLEENILDHVAFHGSLFAAIRKMDLPGIDMLTSDPVGMLEGGSFMGASFMAVKQVASVAHLTGCERVHSESSDWEQRNVGAFASLAQRKGQANLQFVLGVNQITSYFGWQEFTEEEQRGYHDYVGRLASLLTGGRHICDVAVLYPVRTLWSHYLPPLVPIPSWLDRPARSEWEALLSRDYPALVRALLSHQIDLDIIDEEAMLTGEMRDGALRVAGEAYRVLVLPPIDTLSLDVVRALTGFCEAGGQVIFTGAPPTMAESAERTPLLRAELADLLAKDGACKQVSPDDVADAVRAAWSPDLVLSRTNLRVLYTHRWLEGRHVYFVINNAPDPVALDLTLREPGPYTLYRPQTGVRAPLYAPVSLALDAFEGAFVVTDSDREADVIHG